MAEGLIKWKSNIKPTGTLFVHECLMVIVIVWENNKFVLVMIIVIIYFHFSPIILYLEFLAHKYPRKNILNLTKSKGITLVKMRSSYLEDLNSTAT